MNETTSFSGFPHLVYHYECKQIHKKVGDPRTQGYISTLWKNPMIQQFGEWESPWSEMHKWNELPEVYHLSVSVRYLHLR